MVPPRCICYRAGANPRSLYGRLDPPVRQGCKCALAPGRLLSAPCRPCCSSLVSDYALYWNACIVLPEPLYLSRISAGKLDGIRPCFGYILGWMADKKLLPLLSSFNWDVSKMRNVHWEVEQTHSPGLWTWIFLMLSPLWSLWVLQTSLLLVVPCAQYMCMCGWGVISSCLVVCGVGWIISCSCKVACSLVPFCAWIIWGVSSASDSVIDRWWQFSGMCHLLLVLL